MSIDTDPSIDSLLEPELRNPEIAAERLGRLMRVTGVIDQFAEPESRESFVDNLTPDEFITAVSSIDRIVTGSTKSHRHMEAKAGMKIESGSALLGSNTEYIAPAPEDRRKLFEDLLEGIKACGTLEEKALLAAQGINLIHAFADGNGRTARVVYRLLTEGFNPSDLNSTAKVEAAVRQQKDAERDLDLANRTNPVSTKRTLEALRFRALERSDGLQLSAKRLYGGFDADMIDEHSSESFVLSEELVSGELRQYFVNMLLSDQADVPIVTWLYKKGKLEEFTRVPKSPGISSFVDLNLLLPTLTQDDVLEIAQMLVAEPANGVRDFIRFFAHPEEHGTYKVKGEEPNSRQILIAAATN